MIDFDGEFIMILLMRFLSGYFIFSGPWINMRALGFERFIRDLSVRTVLNEI